MHRPHRGIRRLSMMSVLASLFGGLFATGMAAGAFNHQADRGERRKTPKWRRQGVGGFKPHQGGRECARRVGGIQWKTCKAIDRAARGLS